MKSACFARAMWVAAFLCMPLVAQPDVIVGELTGPSNYTADATHDAFSLGTTSCNLGTTPLTWIASTNQHPVIGGRAFLVYPNGRFIQAGRSWLKHGFTALQGNVCNAGCAPHPNGTALGVGCSDPYGSGLNGSQSPLGPIAEINASDGTFPYPPADPSWSGSTDRRLKVPLSLLATPGGRWITDAQYIQFEDAQANNDNNNTSYRFASISGGPTNYSLSFTGPTVREEPAILGWPVLDPGVVIERVEVAGVDGGEFIIGAKRSDNGDGTYHFEYALFNNNVNAGGSAFTVNFANGVAISNMGFHAPENHSNSTVNNNPWAATTASNGVTWTVDQAYSVNPNSNGLRWGTTYSFWFDSTDANPTGASVDFYTITGSATFAAPSFPSPSWQVNQSGSNLDIDGLGNDGFVGPIESELIWGTPHVLNIGGAANQPYDILYTTTPGIANNLVTTNGQIVNLDVAAPSRASFFGSVLTMPGTGYSLGFNTPSVSAFISLQMYNVDPANADGVSLSALNEVLFTDAPRVVVEGVGANTFNSDASNGFWRVTHNGTTTASITNVILDFATATAPATGAWFDTDQNGMNGTFNQGGGYRNGSDVATGLDFSVSAPTPGSGFIATNGIGGNNFETVEFQFTGGLFVNSTFEFDADADPGTVGPAELVGMAVTVILDDASVLTGNFQIDSANRVFVELF